MDIQNIQEKIKEGQGTINDLIEKGLKNPQVESLIENGRTILAREEFKPIVDKWDEARGIVTTRLKSAEEQGRSILETRLNDALAKAKSIEGGLIQLADNAIAEGEKATQENLPFLKPVFDSARSAVIKIDEGFASLQAKASATSGTLPIRDYDKLNAKAAASAVKKLGKTDLLTVRAYETAGKKRVTVLKEIASLLAEN